MSDPLSEDEVRQLLRECVTVVKPGETLVVRMEGLTPGQHGEYQRAVTDWHKHGDLPFPVFIVIGDELGVVEPGEAVVRHEVAPLTDAAFADQLHRVVQQDRRANPGTGFLP